MNLFKNTKFINNNQIKNEGESNNNNNKSILPL